MYTILLVLLDFRINIDFPNNPLSSGSYSDLTGPRSYLGARCQLRACCWTSRWPPAPTTTCTSGTWPPWPRVSQTLSVRTASSRDVSPQLSAMLPFTGSDNDCDFLLLDFMNNFCSGPKDCMFTIKHYFREGLITLSLEYFKVVSKGSMLLR